MRLFTRVRTSPKFTPRLEGLETRDCPAAPVITAFDAIGASASQFMLQGHVSDENPAGLVVGFSGAVSGSAVTDSNGNFGLLVSPSELGLVEAVVTDGENLMSNAAWAALASAAPSITGFGAAHEVVTVWTFTGRVNDEYPNGLVVRFGGLPSLVNRTATCDASGYFSLTVELQQHEWGTATAFTQDGWGLHSNEAMYTIFDY